MIKVDVCTHNLILKGKMFIASVLCIAFSTSSSSCGGCYSFTTESQKANTILTLLTICIPQQGEVQRCHVCVLTRRSADSESHRATKYCRENRGRGQRYLNQIAEQSAREAEFTVGGGKLKRVYSSTFSYMCGIPFTMKNN